VGLKKRVETDSDVKTVRAAMRDKRKKGYPRSEEGERQTQRPHLSHCKRLGAMIEAEIQNLASGRIERRARYSGYVKLIPKSGRGSY